LPRQPDPRSARTIREIVKTTKVRFARDLPIEAAFLDHNSPELPVVVERLARRGHTRVVVVPLFLTRPTTSTSTYQRSLRRPRTRFLA